MLKKKVHDSIIIPWLISASLLAKTYFLKSKNEDRVQWFRLVPCFKSILMHGIDTVLLPQQAAEEYASLNKLEFKLIPS